MEWPFSRELGKQPACFSTGLTKASRPQIKDVRLRRSDSPQEATISPLMPFEHSSIPRESQSCKYSWVQAKSQRRSIFSESEVGLNKWRGINAEAQTHHTGTVIAVFQNPQSINRKSKTINRKVSFGKRLGKPSRFNLGAGFKMSSLFASQNYLPQVI